MGASILRYRDSHFPDRVLALMYSVSNL